MQSTRHRGAMTSRASVASSPVDRPFDDSIGLVCRSQASRSHLVSSVGSSCKFIGAGPALHGDGRRIGALLG
jgi:hypothetical protein